MFRNEMKRDLEKGKKVYGTMLQEMVNPTAAQIFKRAGFDFLWLIVNIVHTIKEVLGKF